MEAMGGPHSALMMQECPIDHSIRWGPLCGLLILKTPNLRDLGTCLGSKMVTTTNE